MSTGARRALAVAAVIFTFVVAASIAAIGSVAVVLPGCERCHLTTEFATAFVDSTHAEIACVDCHVEDTFEGRFAFAVRQVFHMTIPVVPELDRSYAAVSTEICEKCHATMRDPGVAGLKGILINHELCSVGRECTQCHSAVAHGNATPWPRSYDMETCWSCHGLTNSSTECNTCHADGRTPESVFADGFEAVHPPGWREAHGMGEIRFCAACHVGATCSSCHEEAR